MVRYFTELRFPFPRECNNGVNRHLAIAERVRGANGMWNDESWLEVRIFVSAPTRSLRRRAASENRTVMSAKRTVSRIRRRGSNGDEIGGGKKRRVSSKSDRYRRYRCSSYLAAEHTRIYKRRERKRELSRARYRGITVIARTHDFHISPASQWCIQCLIYVVPRPRDRWIFSTAIKRKLHADYEIVIRRSIPPRREN